VLHGINKTAEPMTAHRESNPQTGAYAMEVASSQMAPVAHVLCWALKAVAAAMHTGIPNAHDGYLDIFLDGGLIALFLLSCILFTSGRRLIKNLPLHRYNLLRFAFLIIAIVHNLTESSFARLSALWFTTLLMILEFPNLRDKLNSISIRKPAVPKSEASRLDPTGSQPPADEGFGVGLRQEVF
jgi:hypothetical protein